MTNCNISDVGDDSSPVKYGLVVAQEPSLSPRAALTKPVQVPLAFADLQGSRHQLDVMLDRTDIPPCLENTWDSLVQLSVVQDWNHAEICKLGLVAVKYFHPWTHEDFS